MSENKENLDSKKKLFKNEADSLDQENVESLKQKLDECQVAQQEWKERCMRLTADMANFNKRTDKEKAQWSELARADTLTPLLNIIDDFERAIEKEQVSEGIAMIHATLLEFLKNAGVSEVSYVQFDPEFHEALMQVESDGKESGTIVEVMQKGYALGDKVLRAAKVSVAK